METIYVFADWMGLSGPLLMGTLGVSHDKGSEIFSFNYEKEWLKSNHSQVLDPELQMFEGPQYQKDGKLFGIIGDSLPDRWGRKLMDRKEAIYARKEDRPQRQLFESDYLLGIHDESRMGGIRFKKTLDGPFLNSDGIMKTPPINSIRDIQFAASKAEEDTIHDNPEENEWINMIINPGGSLGGARPKSNIRMMDGSLWIAKFPSNNDDVDKGAWEYLTYQMAIDAGINIAKSYVDNFDLKNRTFLTRRFDRDNNDRIHYASAATMTGLDETNDQSSYLDIVEFLMSNGANIKEDLKQLFTRIAFHVAVRNTDDHFRNHGFILTKIGWVLSPAFDVNPEPKGRQFATAIDEKDNSVSMDLVRSVYEYFKLEKVEADVCIEKVLDSVSSYKKRAQALNISPAEIELMSVCFGNK